jgi:hypothetical protein
MYPSDLTFSYILESYLQIAPLVSYSFTAMGQCVDISILYSCCKKQADSSNIPQVLFYNKKESNARSSILGSLQFSDVAGLVVIVK